MSEMPDLSALFSMLSNNNATDKKPEEMLISLMNSSSNSNSANNSYSDNANFSNNQNDGLPDMETIIKIMKLMNTSNQDSPSKELLKSLKPFLNDSRKEKVDQYIKILGMTKIFEIFNELGDKSK